MNQQLRQILLASIILTLASACAPLITKHRMEIKDTTIACPDSVWASCLLVKIDTMRQWQPWPMAKPIHGFTYQHGFMYELAVEEVRTRKSENPPWWRLVEVMSKEAFVEQRPTIYGTKWALTAMGPASAPVALPAGVEITLGFSEYGSVSGNSGCNRYFAECSLPGGDKITFTHPGSTRMMCNQPAGVMEWENSFLESLANAETFGRERDQLVIQVKNGTMLTFDRVEE